MSKPEPLRFETTYHIYNRGNNGESLFRTPENYTYFLQLYTKHFYPYANTYAYCLLPNHFHFCLSIRPEAEIVAHFLEHQTGRVLKTRPVSGNSTIHRLKTSPSQAFGNLCNAYTKAINKRYGRTGALFERPFHRKRVENPRYFQNLIIYIHQNPQAHGLIDDFQEWPYSSYGTILSKKETRVAKTAVFSQFETQPHFIERHSQIIKFDFE